MWNLILSKCVYLYGWILTEYYHRRERIRLIASIESALGIMNIKEIVTADPRLDALIVSLIHYGTLYSHLNVKYSSLPRIIAQIWD